MKPAPETKWRESPAYAPRFFLSMAIALVVFAVISYASTGSIATTALRTVVCGVLIQVGYFLATLFLVRRAARARQAALEKSKPKVSVSMNEPGHSKP
ncbi:exopolysaccharide production repressor protein [Shinella zoogloeoides]